MWDESKHPRVPKGYPNGGQFKPRGYSSLESEVEKISRRVNIKTNLKKLCDKQALLLIRIDLQFFTEKDIKNQFSNSLKRSMRKFIKKIELHKDKINNPRKYIPDWDQKDPREQNGIIKWWKREIRNYTNSYNERVEELKRRGDYDDE